MKKIAFILTALVLSLGVQAKSLVLKLNDNTLVYYLLGGTTNPTMKFNDNGLTVNADAYTFSGISCFYISETDDPTGIEQITVRDAKGQTSDAIKIYTLDGKVVATGKATTDKDIAVSLSSLSKGTYIVRTSTSSFKITKK